MTARVTTLKGPDAGAYYVEALPSYYLDSGEPRGTWHGRGAELLGLDGEIIDAEFMAIMGGHHPHRRGAVPLGRAYGDESVRGFDITASAPKSVSTLFALGDEDLRHQVLTAHDRAVETMLGWVEDHAHTRYRIGGEVAVVDAEGIIAATFRQHTSRVLDPQLHTHVVIANRVRSDDGRWLALDARSLKMDQRTLSGIYHMTLRSQLTTELGVFWEPVVNGIAEIAGMPEPVLEEFSSRAGDVQRRIDVKIDRFCDTFDRDPTPRERWRLEREAVTDSRPPKPKGADHNTLHETWRAQIEALGINPDQAIEQTLEWTKPTPLDRATVDQAIQTAIETLSEKQSTWRPAELTREIAAAIPTSTAINPADVGSMLDTLTTAAIEQRCVDISRPVPEQTRLRRDGRPVTESIKDRALTTPEILAQERRLLAWAERRMGMDPIDNPQATQHSDVTLTGPQADTAAAIAGDAHLVFVVGPAGTGKTTALAPAVAQLQAEGRAVFGLAPSAVAADVLTTETGVAADTIDKLLYEHNADRPPDHRFNLPPGTTVIVDEAGMASTDKLDQLAALADQQAWRIAMVGDPMQFSAVGRGGMFEHLIDTHGGIELDQVHRFSNDWERQASLRLRRGDTTVVETYDEQARLHGGTRTRMKRDALDAWTTARANNETVLLTAPTNDTVTRLNHQAQQRRIDTGEINTAGRTIQSCDYRLHAGDEIVTRRNHRQLHTDRGLPIRNRDQWTIDTIHRDGAITAHGQSGTVKLPADYVSEHVQLAYAQTSHAAQGRTVDRSILVLDAPTDSRGIYVPMTRGRHHNDAYIVTNGEHTATDIFANSIANNWIDRTAHARQAELAGADRHRPGTLDPDELRNLLAQQTQLNETLERLDRDLDYLPRDRRSVLNEQADVQSRLAETRSRIDAAHNTLDAHDRPFRRRGHETAIENSKQTLEHAPATIATQTAKLATLDGRLQTIDTRLGEARQLATRQPAIETRLTDIGDRLTDDRRNRSHQLRRNPTEHITSTLGTRPSEAQPGQAWDIAAGQLDQHHTAFDKTSRGVAGFEQSLSLTKRVISGLNQATQPDRGIEGPGLGIGR